MVPVVMPLPYMGKLCAAIETTATQDIAWEKQLRMSERHHEAGDSCDVIMRLVHEMCGYDKRLTTNAGSIYLCMEVCPDVGTPPKE